MHMVFIFCRLSQIHMIKKLQAKGDSGKEEIFQRVMFGRAESHEIEDVFPQKDTGKYV